MVVHSTARLFADDCIVYRPIRNNDDTIILQNDLNKIAEWEFIWQMQFNIDKCFILRVGRPKHKLVHLYTLHNQNVSETDSAKYLGLTITSDLQWNQHINNTRQVTRATHVRNRICPRVKLIIKIIIILLIIFLGFIKSKSC